MFDDATNALPPYVNDLRAWLDEWYDHACRFGMVQPPFTLDETIADRLEGYFQAGLTPAEGAIAFFGTVH
ncbi:hypothetical protein AWB74_07621 [Caballeronia arvi]|uniref:Uncharacterized protein n=1 Tax=Caballeronia arvi TaxID=1777135 RepID=A0A158L0R4_9BURK|nr:hypothetical protein [Caballeronia arvi]SAL86241.1 hypothetical protein AWB74_07621 [Caballeronia arvi]